MKRLSKLLTFGGICIILLGMASQAQAAPAHSQQQTFSYSVSGSPTVSVAFINQVLASNQSPAAGKGLALFDDGIKYGIDPVYALAFFMHESSFGRTGVAQYTLSLGNLRCIPLYSCYDGFSAFPSWEAGFEAWYSLIRNVYVDVWNLSTVEQIIPVYAPASDHNDVAAYISAIESAVDTWRSGQIAQFGPITSQSSGTTQGTTVTSVPPLAPFPADSYSILGKPTVNSAFIDQILAHYHSPAAGKGTLFIAEGAKYGIDPIYALAFFMNDSILGTVGLALHTHSLGPLPTPVTATCRCQDAQGYRLYTTWDDGISDWFQYIHDYYIKQLGLTSVSQIVSLYLRTHDTRAIDLAIKGIESRVDLWRKAQTLI